jgi:hypothetical protein
VQIAWSGGWREGARKMLQTGEMVDADAGRDRSIVTTIGGRVNQRGGAAPVFVRGVGEKYLRDDAFRDGAVEQAAFVSGDRIGFRLVGERKNVRGKEHRGGRLRVARRLSETIVEASAACARDVSEHAVE